MNWQQKSEPIKALIFDIDGVMTNGLIGYTGDSKVKFFNVQDGHAIKLAMRAGLLVGTLSGRDDAANLQRGEDLGLSFMYAGAVRKGETFLQLLQEQKLCAEECLYIGDDVIDIPVMRQAGIAVCVADAVEEVFPYVDYVTKAPGGQGAIQEVVRLVLKAKNLWDGVMKRYVE